MALVMALPVAAPLPAPSAHSLPEGIEATVSPSFPSGALPPNPRHSLAAASGHRIPIIYIGGSAPDTPDRDHDRNGTPPLPARWHTGQGGTQAYPFRGINRGLARSALTHVHTISGCGSRSSGRAPRAARSAPR